MKRTTVFRCLAACICLFGLFRMGQCYRDQGKHWDQVHKEEAKAEAEQARQVAAAAPPTIAKEAPPAAAGMDPGEVAQLTVERKKALKLRDSIDRILTIAAMSFPDGVASYCRFYLDQSPEFQGINDDAETLEKMRSDMFTLPATREEAIARQRQAEPYQKWFLAYEECNASIMAGSMQMPSKLDMELRADRAEKDIAEIDRKLTHPDQKSPRWLPLP